MPHLDARLKDMKGGRRHRPEPLYVEILIRCELDDLWEKTQDPKLHQRWDLRFTSIDYLPRVNPDKPQAFRYARNFGIMTISGVGETVGERTRPDGRATSALRFWSDHPLSLIREGSGYWRYVPTDEGIRFLTRYDYSVRFGPLGRWVDRAVWRPLMGWATAWSFDALRLWLEHGVEPEDSLRSAVRRATTRVALPIVGVAALGRQRSRGVSTAALAALGVASVVTSGSASTSLIPTAKNCRRQPPEEKR